MCRLFATLSDGRLDARDPLLKSSQSLMVQSHADPKHPQADGWGLGWVEGNRPRVFKSPRPLFREKPSAQRAAAKVTGPFLLGHVRWASNPLKLPKRDLIGLNHTQPFNHGRWLFAHNGTLYIPREVRAELGPWKRWVKGQNDSEVLFYWLLKDLSSLLAHPQRISASQCATAVNRSYQGLDALWHQCRKKYPLFRYAYHGLNWILSDGATLIAHCYVDPNGFDRNKALLNRRQPYYQMQWQQAPGRLTVASEPLDPSTRWTPFKHGALVLARRTRQGLVTQWAKVR